MARFLGNDDRGMTDAVADWLRKDKVTHALVANGTLEVELHFTGSWDSFGTVSLHMVAGEPGSRRSFNLFIVPANAITKDMLRTSSPSDEYEGAYWKINPISEERSRMGHFHSEWKIAGPVAIDEFCTLHDAVLYLVEVYS